MSTLNGHDLLGFVALREPSRLITTSELSIMSMLCPDKMLPSRSGTGADSTSALDWGTPIPRLQEYICSFTSTSRSKTDGFYNPNVVVLYFLSKEHLNKEKE